ncbi:MAG: ABC transporter ATP-binding protein [Candidatus Margulisiibacteriota bacterium]|jgi:putative ABC transport system ATP-binding protein
MLIKLKNVQKKYLLGTRELIILKNIDLNVKEKEYLALMGPSGSGKSTLMNILGCMDLPTKGHFFLDTVDMLKQNQRQLAELRRNKIGFIFQTFNLISSLTALENIELPLVYNRVKDKGHKAQNLLSLVGLSHRGQHYPNQLSGGERQRVAIARALVNDPKLILADEPTGNLDSKSGEQILTILRNLHKENRTIIIVTHDEHVAKQAERIIHLKDGEIYSEEINHDN